LRFVGRYFPLGAEIVPIYEITPLMHRPTDTQIIYYETEKNIICVNLHEGK